MSIATTARLPLRPREGAGTPDTFIEEGPVGESLVGSRMRGPLFEAAPGQLLIRTRRIAKLLVSEGKALRFERLPEATPEAVANLVLGWGLSALLHQRGALALHASAVRIGERGAALFLGAAGAGKSTLARACTLRGWHLLDDNTAAIGFSGDGGPVVYPGSMQAKLWPTFPRLLDGLASRPLGGTPERPKVAVDLGRSFWPAPVPVRRIYRLASASANQPRVEPIEGRNKFLLLLNNLAAAHLVPACLRSLDCFSAILSTVSQTAMGTLQVPRGLQGVEDAVALVEQEMAVGARGRSSDQARPDCRERDADGAR
ncbi:MAG: hypothetical protein HYV63_31600 [Candidatus Schekmanbacteria bacterium]|nr:hypothetical protein [Candidatus Schekmanbacteria bacterium]